MIYKGLFHITSLSNTKYIWQYEINKQNSDYQIYNVIRPCVLIKNHKRFWDFNTPTINNLKLNNNDVLDIDNVIVNNHNIIFEVTWTLLYNNDSVEKIKKSPIGNMIYSLASAIEQTPEDDNIDETLDKAVLFCHKMSNSIQLLQDRISSIENKSVPQSQSQQSFSKKCKKTYTNTFN